MGKRYGCLPSEALARGNTFDLYILSQVLGYYHRKDNPDNAINSSTGGSYSQEELLAILNRNKVK